MKKLKIFLLISILLCFGFALSPEVHAQGGGPKVFEVGDVLPASLIAIYGEVEEEESVLITFNNNYIQLDNISGYSLNTDFPYSDKSDNFMIIDLTLVSLSDREVVGVQDYWGFIEWEEVITGYTITFNSNGGSTIPDIEEVTELPISLPIPTKENHTFLGWYYGLDFIDEAFANDPLTDDVILYARWSPGKLFEVDDVLPATTELKIRIYFKYGDYDYHVETVDRSGIYLSIDLTGGVKDLYVEIGGVLQHDGVTSADEIYYTINTLDWSLNQRTIKSVSSENGTFVTWEDSTPDGYTQGYLEAREEFGYYDSRTNEWLSVEEYLDLYGTDKPGQSDFYGNFDKYFIPAMIIVFGGAIVLTILKVFKGRE